MNRVERFNVKIGIVRELVIEHGRRPQQLRGRVDADHAVALHERLQPVQQTLAVAKNLPSACVHINRDRGLSEARSGLFRVRERQRVIDDHVGQGRALAMTGQIDRSPFRVHGLDFPDVFRRGSLPGKGNRRAERLERVERRRQGARIEHTAGGRTIALEEAEHRVADYRARRPS